jgi:hypothetical protein
MLTASLQAFQRATRSLTSPSRMKNVVGLVAFVFVVNFTTMPASEYMGDAMAVRMQAITLINSGQFAIPADLAREAGAPGQYFYENANGRFYPKYGIFNTFIYMPALLLEKILAGHLPSAEHTLYLNLFNIVLSCLTVGYLALLARRYTNSNVTILIFVLASLYSTFWWNYLRAQTFEIYLTLLMLAFYYHFISARERERAGARHLHFLGAATCLGLLCLCKTVYVILLPVIVAFFAFDAARREPKNWFAASLFFFWIPLSIFICLLLASNGYRFGSPFNTGYTQWSQEARVFTANLLPGLIGFLASKQGVFLHFPVLIFALVGWPRFFGQHKRGATLIISIGTILLLITSAFTNWKGESCYGPRYLLPVLPLLNLPFISFWDWVRRSPTKLIKWIVRLTVAGSLGYACVLQIAVNSLPFFFFYDLVAIVDAEPEGPAPRYLCSHQFGTINVDFIRYATGRSSRFRDDFVRALNSTEFVRLEGLKAETSLNYYWFPRAVETLP